ncbi:MAG: hypothetical protein KDK03_09800 [Rhodobacteraceae bacterium]|nr:hypothetical protein [Paracoccaceae bacterium]
MIDTAASQERLEQLEKSLFLSFRVTKNVPKLASDGLSRGREILPGVPGANGAAPTPQRKARPASKVQDTSRSKPVPKAAPEMPPETGTPLLPRRRPEEGNWTPE